MLEVGQVDGGELAAQHGELVGAPHDPLEHGARLAARLGRRRQPEVGVVGPLDVRRAAADDGDGEVLVVLQARLQPREEARVLEDVLEAAAARLEVRHEHDGSRRRVGDECANRRHAFARRVVVAFLVRLERARHRNLHEVNNGGHVL